MEILRQAILSMGLTALLIHTVTCGLAAGLLANSRGLRRPWLWVLVGLVFNPVPHILKQYKRLPTPPARAWAIRFTVAAVLSGVLIGIAKSPLMQHPALIALQGDTASLFRGQPVVRSGRQMQINEMTSIALPDFDSTPLWLAAAGVVIGATFFRNPYEKMLLLAIVCLFLGPLVVAVHLAVTMEALGDARVGPFRVQNIYDLKPVFVGWLPYILLIWVTFAWAAWDSRRIEAPEESHGAPLTARRRQSP